MYLFGNRAILVSIWLEVFHLFSKMWRRVSDFTFRQNGTCGQEAQDNHTIMGTIDTMHGRHAGGGPAMDQGSTAR
jgi:hypothetical protein